MFYTIIFDTSQIISLTEWNRVPKITSDETETEHMTEKRRDQSVHNKASKQLNEMEVAGYSKCTTEKRNLDFYDKN